MLVHYCCFAILGTFLTYQLANAAIYREPHTKHPERDACVSMEFNVTIDVGKEAKIPEKCVALHCNKAYEVVLSTCVVTIFEKPCFIVPGNSSLTYPDCCDQVECPKDNKIPTLETVETVA